PRCESAAWPSRGSPPALQRAGASLRLSKSLRELVRVDRLHARVGADQDHVRAAAREDAVRHRARDLIDPGLQISRIEDPQVLDIEEDVAVVGDEVLPQLRTTAELHELVRGV